MRKLLLIIGLTLVQVSLSWGQWTSPGNGTTYTLRDLVAASEGCVTHATGSGAYHINHDLTIAAHDRLTVVPDDFTTIDADAGGIICRGNVLLTIQGGLVIDGGDIDVYLEPDSISRLRVVLDHGTEPSRFVHTKMFYMSGIKVIETEVAFDDCMFQSFDKTETLGAVQYQNCDPVFVDCIFQGNYGSAISGVNGSPQIDRCQFRYNVLSKEDMPQLDFCQGGDDTLRIRDSRVVGLYPLVSGIRITDTQGQGDTKVLLQGNFIADNRYGYLQHGDRIDALFRDNEIVCNRIAPDPTGDGSGVCVIGTSANCKATLRHNLLHSNSWGVTVFEEGIVDLGTPDDPGHNIIYDNQHNHGDGDQTFALYVGGSHDVNAVGNYWGGTTEAFAESVIYHRPDLGDDHGLVSYSPILTVNDWTVEETPSAAAKVYPNPTEGNVTLCMEQVDGFSYEVFNPMGQRVLHGHADGPTTTLDLGPFAPGIYLVSLKADGQTFPILQRIIR